MIRRGAAATTGISFAIAAACALLAVVAACRFTEGLTGGPVLDAGGDAPSEADGDVDAGEAGDDCDADLTRSVANCGACGHVCDVGGNGFAACVDGGCVVGCPVDFADCNADASDGCEVYLPSARANCGRCGHDCGVRSSCAVGACQPVVLAQGLDAPSHIAVDVDETDTDVWGISAYGTVTRSPKSGSGASVRVAGRVFSQNPPPRIALVDGALYWTLFGAPSDAGVADASDASADASDASDASDAAAAADASDAAPGSPIGGVYTLTPDGGAPHLLTTATDPLAITASAGYVYWSEGNPLAASPSGSIRRCKATSCASTAETIVPEASGRVFDIAVTGTTLVWTNQGTPPLDGDGLLGKCTVNACISTATTLAQQPKGPFGLAVDTKTAFFTTAANYVASCGLGGCSAQPFHVDVSQYTPHFIVVDGNDLLWTNSDGTIKSIPKIGPPDAERTLVEIHGLNGTSPWAIASDKTAVYWTDLAGIPGAGGAALRKLPK